MRRFRPRAVLAAVAATAGVVATACQSPPSQPAAPPENSAAAAPSGVLAVKLDNAPEGRPPVGVNEADVVYVEPVEGGLSRLLAVYGHDKPDLVGPVRSARETDLALLPQFGHPALAFSGAAPALLPRIADAPIRDVSDGAVGNAYTRQDSRPEPHNLFVRPDQLPAGEQWAPRAALPFGPPSAHGAPTDGDQVRYRAATVGFSWQPQQHRWQVRMDGEPYASDSGPVTPSTVVIQHVRSHDSTITDVAGAPSPVAETVGSGTARVLRDGQAFDVRWSRSDPTAPTSYTTEDGSPVTFAPGQVWVVLDDS